MPTVPRVHGDCSATTLVVSVDRMNGTTLYSRKDIYVMSGLSVLHETHGPDAERLT